jgi:hypothetical protein
MKAGVPWRNAPANFAILTWGLADALKHLRL